MRPTSSPSATLAHALGKGATVLDPDGRDVTSTVRSTFARLLPACGGDRAAAAAQAVRAALGEQRETAR